MDDHMTPPSWDTAPTDSTSAATQAEQLVEPSTSSSCAPSHTETTPHHQGDSSLPEATCETNPMDVLEETQPLTQTVLQPWDTPDQKNRRPLRAQHHPPVTRRDHHTPQRPPVTPQKPEEDNPPFPVALVVVALVAVVVFALLILQFLEPLLNILQTTGETQKTTTPDAVVQKMMPVLDNAIHTMLFITIVIGVPILVLKHLRR